MAEFETLHTDIGYRGDSKQRTEFLTKARKESLISLAELMRKYEAENARIAEAENARIAEALNARIAAAGLLAGLLGKKGLTRADSFNENREPKRKIQINVETIERKVYVISGVTTHDSVSDLKSKICSEQMGTLPADIILAFQQNELIDDKTLESYGITNGATLNVLPRVSGKVDWIPGLLKDSSRVLTDIDLMKIAQGIGKGWEILGLSLGLDRVQLDHITDDNKSTVMRIYTMLTTWLGEKGSEATVGTLYQTMTDCNGVRFNWTKLKSVFSDVCLSGN